MELSITQRIIIAQNLFGVFMIAMLIFLAFYFKSDKKINKK